MSLQGVSNRKHFEPDFPSAILQQIPDFQGLADRVNEVYYKNKQDPKLINTIIDMGADYLDSHPELYDKLKKIQTSIGVYLSRICIRASLNQLSKEKSAELEKQKRKANEATLIVSSAQQARNGLQNRLISFEDITTAFSNIFFRVKTNVPSLEEQSKKLHDRVVQMKFTFIENLKSYSLIRFALTCPKIILTLIGVDYYYNRQDYLWNQRKNPRIALLFLLSLFLNFIDQKTTTQTQTSNQTATGKRHIRIL